MSVNSLTVKNKFIPVLSDLANHLKLVNYEIVFEPHDFGVDGYCSNINRVQILSKDQELNLVTKSNDANDTLRQVIPITSLFDREIYVYESVLPSFKQFEIDRGVHPSEFAPKYYQKRTNEYDGDIIILENLKKIGYSLYSKRDLLDDNHIKLVLRHYANLHAISLAYRDQIPDEFNKLIETLKDQLIVEVLKNNQYVNMFIKQLKKGADSLHCELDKRQKKVYERFISKCQDYMLETLTKFDEFSVIAHADCWKNNMMFTYENSKDPTMPTQVRLVDFQVARFSSPMLDVANFFYTCSPMEALDKLQFYLDYYYNCLSNRVRQLGSIPEILYPRSVMNEHWNQFAGYGLITRSSILVILFSDETEQKALSEVIEESGSISNMLDYKLTDLDKFNKINRHTILHFVNNNFI